jgi:hypothetical protein
LGLACAQLVFALLVEPMYQPVQDRGWAGLGHSYAWQDPARTVPSADQRARAAGLREALRTEAGPVLALGRPWWSVIAGGEGHVGSMGINDVDPQARREIQAALRRQLEAGHYRSVWFEGAPPSWLRGALRGYRVAQRHRGDARVRPMTGYMSEAGMVTPYSGEQILFVRSSR